MFKNYRVKINSTKIFKKNHPKTSNIAKVFIRSCEEDKQRKQIKFKTYSARAALQINND